MKPTQPAPAETTVVSGDTYVDQRIIFNTQINLILEEQHKSQGGKGHHKPAPSKGHVAKDDGLIKPSVTTDPRDGDQLITYLSKDGSSATFRSDRQNNGAISLTLLDAAGSITTHADHRGYEVKHTGRDGKVTFDHTDVDSKIGKFFEHSKGAVDRMVCSGYQKDVNITPSVTDQVTLDQLQTFLAPERHRQLRDTLAKVDLPATVVGGKQMTVGEALTLPTNFAGCPAGKREGIAQKTPNH